MAEISIAHLHKQFGNAKRPAIKDVDLHVADGELMVLLGPSGCGKTTLLRMIAGLEYPDAGGITIGSRDVTALPPRKRQIAMVFQSYAVFPHLTVFDNIAFGLRMHHETQETIKRKVARVAAMVQLEELLGRYSAQLSGGQRQRVAVARAIVMEPAVLLMDEPLSNLDALLRLQFRADLKQLVQEVKTTTVYVTHDQVEALSLGNRIAVMRDGEIVQCDTPMRVYDAPTETFVGGFIGNPPMNFLRGRAGRIDGRVRIALGAQMLEGPREGALAENQDLLLGIRAENIAVLGESALGAYPVSVQVAELLGSGLLLTATIEGQPLKLIARNDFPLRLGQTVWIRPDPGKMRWFDAATQRAIGEH